MSKNAYINESGAAVPSSWNSTEVPPPRFPFGRTAPERTNHAKGRAAQGTARIFSLFAAQTKRRKDVFP